MAGNLIDFDTDLPGIPVNHLSRNGPNTTMDVDSLETTQWKPDEVSLNYLRNLTRKYKGNPHARRVPATHTWIQAKSGELEPHQRDRLLSGAPIEDALPDYDADNDDDACLLVQKIGKGTALAFQACIREHISYLCETPTSKAAFPNGLVTPDRIQHFLTHRYNRADPDHGCTAEECCPNLLEPACSPWNVTFVDVVTADFVSKVAEDWYSEHGLPVEALIKKVVASRVLVCLRSQIKSTQRTSNLDTADKILESSMHGRYMQRRRSKHNNRVRICDGTPQYNKYFALLKAVGPEGNSDEETDTEAGITPLPIKVYPLKWRSREYEALLHKLDAIQRGRDNAALLHMGPIRSSPRKKREEQRTRVRATNAASKFLSNTCPTGKPTQFYDSRYLRDAEAQGLLPSLRIGSSYPHALPRA